jgi:hypothetical protein
MTTTTGRGTMTAIRRLSLFLALVLTLAACDKPGPAEVRSDGEEFPLRATWSAAVTPVGSATIQASLTINENLGSHMQAVVNVTGGAPNATYQWRIYRGGNCSVNVAATSNTAGDGLVIFATTQSYPDLVTNASGAATMTRTIAGSLDPLGAYSVRVRVAQSSTNWNGVNPIACGNLQRS